jgi:3-dehydroquinate dehydratase II
MTVSVLILNGPNLNLLGYREPEVYGHDTLADVEALCRSHADSLGLAADCRQSNHEGQLIDWVHEARTAFAGIVINPGAYSHTSIALLDAVKAVQKPVIEVHLSNIHQRESFRHHSYISQAAKGVICGLGIQGYVAALDAMARWLSPPAQRDTKEA